MLLTAKLFGFLNRVFLKDPKATLAFQLFYDGAMTWTIADGTLTINVIGGSGANQVIDLTANTISSLCFLLGSRMGFTVANQNIDVFAGLSAAVLLDSSGDQSVTGGNNFNGYTSTVWAWMDAAAKELTLANSQSGAALLEMSVPTADGGWLDVHGNYYDTPRLSGELDDVYAPRIIANVINAKGNNVAIEAALAIAFNAVAVTVDDYNTITVSGGGTPSYGLFDIDLMLPLGAPADLSVNVSARSIIDKFRDAGTHLRTLTVTITSDLVEDVLMVLTTGSSISIYFSTFNEIREDGGKELREDGGVEILELTNLVFYELREDFSYQLRQDNSYELKE